MHTIKLQRTITVRTFDALATVAIGRERPEWLAVARLAKDFGGEITADQVRRELLGGVSPVAGQRVIERCVALGLLEHAEPRQHSSPARLTALGNAALEQGEVFVPEERLWRFYYVDDDPLVVNRLLHVEPLNDGDAKAERQQMRAARDPGRRDKSQGDDCPARLRTDLGVGTAMASVVEGGPSFILRTPPQAGSLSNEESLTLHLDWPVEGQPQVRLTGQWERQAAGRRKQDPPPRPLVVNRLLETPSVLGGLTHPLVWMELVAYGARLDLTTLEDWRNRAGRLVLPKHFRDLHPPARNSFQDAVSVPEVPNGLPGALERIGGFDETKLTGVEVVPASDADAQQWAEWLLRESLTTYATPATLKESAAKTRARFSFHSPTLPSPEEMLRQAVAKPTDAKARFLLAPYDLGLWS